MESETDSFPFLMNLGIQNTLLEWGFNILYDINSGFKTTCFVDKKLFSTTICFILSDTFNRPYG
jgi:hypothetical protein